MADEQLYGGQGGGLGEIQKPRVSKKAYLGPVSARKNERKQKGFQVLSDSGFRKVDRPS